MKDGEVADMLQLIKKCYATLQIIIDDYETQLNSFEQFNYNSNINSSPLKTDFYKQPLHINSNDQTAYEYQAIHKLVNSATVERQPQINTHHVPINPFELKHINELNLNEVVQQENTPLSSIGYLTSDHFVIDKSSTTTTESSHTQSNQSATSGNSTRSLSTSSTSATPLTRVPTVTQSAVMTALGEMMAAQDNKTKIAIVEKMVDDFKQMTIQHLMDQ